jgi:glycosyltransferase involved in cell wall biosynthesis
MTPLARVVPEHIPMTLDLDEDDRMSFASQAEAARRKGNGFQANWLDQEGYACDGLIAAAAGRFQLAFLACDRDRANLASRHSGLGFKIAPNAVEIPRQTTRIEDGCTILFVGTLGYEPNAEGILWFARTIMPRLRTSFGRCRLAIAGANPPPAVQALGHHPDTRVLGFVDDLDNLYRRASLAVAPMQAGGGTRIKVLEAAAHGVATVASQQAADGLFTTQQPWGWICDRPADFLAASVSALANPRERRQRGQLARRSVTKHYSRSVVVPRLAAMLRECCG